MKWFKRNGPTEKAVKLTSEGYSLDIVRNQYVLLELETVSNLSFADMDLLEYNESDYSYTPELPWGTISELSRRFDLGRERVRTIVRKHFRTNYNSRKLNTFKMR